MYRIFLEEILEKLIGPDIRIISKKWKGIMLDVVVAGVLTAVCISISIGVFLLSNEFDGIGRNVAKPETFYVWYYPLLILRYAFTEEVIYRLLPLSGAVWGAYLWMKYVTRKESPKTVLTIAVLVTIPVSAYFGYIHGDWRNIFIQGFGGLAFAFIFLKYGGLERRLVAPIVCSTLCHASYNMVVFTPYVAAHFLGT